VRLIFVLSTRKWRELFDHSRHFFLSGEKKELTRVQWLCANLRLPGRIYSDEVRSESVRSSNVESAKFCLQQ
jgi:hypothetical protein